MPDIENEAECLVACLEEALVERVSEKLVRPEDRRGLAEEFVEFLGKLVAVVGQEQPSVAKGAAFLVFVQRLGLDRAKDDAAYVMMALVEAAKNGIRKARRERGA